MIPNPTPETWLLSVQFVVLGKKQRDLVEDNSFKLFMHKQLVTLQRVKENLKSHHVTPLNKLISVYAA